MTAEFADLLKSSDVTVEQILGSHGLIAAVKSELPALYDFVSKEDQLIGLAEWAVSTKYAEHSKYLEYSVIAVSIFLSANTNLFETIRGSRGLAHFFHNFLAGEDSKNARLCGHFSRIFGAQMRWGTPCLFLLYDDVLDLLLNRIEILAIREFLVVALQTSASAVLDPAEVIGKLTEMTENQDTMCDALSCLIDLYNTLSTDHGVLHAFHQPLIISRLVEASIRTESVLLATDVIKILTSLSFLDDECIQLTGDQRDILTVRPGNITPLSAASINLVNITDRELFELFFEPESHKCLHSALMKIFDDMDRDELLQIASIPSFLDQLVDSYGTPAWCPHMFHIALMFSATGITSKIKNKLKWKRFLCCQFAHFTRVMDCPYGGRLPASSEDSEIETDDDLYLQDDSMVYNTRLFEEEEEEEEMSEANENDEGFEIESDDSGEVDIVV